MSGGTGANMKTLWNPQCRSVTRSGTTTWLTWSFLQSHCSWTAWPMSPIWWQMTGQFTPRRLIRSSPWAPAGKVSVHACADMFVCVSKHRLLVHNLTPQICYWAVWSRFSNNTKAICWSWNAAIFKWLNGEICFCVHTMCKSRPVYLQNAEFVTTKTAFP